jgi:hypothetical protein
LLEEKKSLNTIEKLQTYMNWELAESERLSDADLQVRSQKIKNAQGKLYFLWEFGILYPS